MNARVLRPILVVQLLALHVACAQESLEFAYNDVGREVRVTVPSDRFAVKFAETPTQEVVDNVRDTLNAALRQSGAFVQTTVSPAANDRQVFTGQNARVFTVDSNGDLDARSQNELVVMIRESLSDTNLPVDDVGVLVYRGAVEAGRVPAIMTDRLIVRFNATAAIDDLPGALRQQLEVVAAINERRRIELVRVRPTSPLNAIQAANALAELDDVVQYAVPALISPREFRAYLPSSNPLFPPNAATGYAVGQWYLNNQMPEPSMALDADINAPEAWEITRGSPTTLIAVIDDAVDTDHEDLKLNLAAGRDFYDVATPDNHPDPSGPQDAHGTHVAGIIGAIDNQEGGVGVCHRCRIIPIRVNIEKDESVTAGIYYAIDNGARVINNSWGNSIGSYGPVGAVVSAIGEAYEEDIAVFFAVPDKPEKMVCDGTGDISTLPAVIAVGVSNERDRVEIPGFVGLAAYGDCLDIVAPSKPDPNPLVPQTTWGVVTTALTNTNAGNPVWAHYTFDFGGSSAAVPEASGTAGLMISMNALLDVEGIRSILHNSAKKIDLPSGHAYDNQGFNMLVGYGRLDALLALVPTTKVRFSKPQVAVDELFDVTVRASALFGLSEVGIRGANSGVRALEDGIWEDVDGEFFVEKTWTVSIPVAGEYVIQADARDLQYPSASSYPHQASDGPGARSAVIDVVGSGRPRAPVNFEIE